MTIKTKIGKKQKFRKASEEIEYWYIAFQLTCFFRLTWNEYKIIKNKVKYIIWS